MMSTRAGVGPRRRLRHRALVLILLLGAAFARDIGPAHGTDGSYSVSAGEDERSRGTWAALLLGYLALGALATGGTYALRDNIFGRSLSVTAAGWGGLGVGAGAGYGLQRLRGCGTADCSTEEQVAISAGGLVGALAGTIVGHMLTSDPGMSRPYTTMAGLAPGLLFLMVGTIVDW